jgi:hypothetical protein
MYRNLTDQYVLLFIAPLRSTAWSNVEPMTFFQRRYAMECQTRMATQKAATNTPKTLLKSSPAFSVSAPRLLHSFPDNTFAVCAGLFQEY